MTQTCEHNGARVARWARGLAASVCVLFCGQAWAAAPPLEMEELEEGVWVHYGEHLSVRQQQPDDIANIGFIVGERCVAVVDTGGSIQLGQRLLAALRQVSDKPVCYVINTHIHYDHLLGNKAFVAEKPRFVGHSALAGEVEHNREFFLTEFRGNLDEDPGQDDIIGPDILVEKSMELDLGERVLQLIAFSPAHSHSDLAVFDQKTSTLWSGDLVFRERIPTLSASLKGWVAAMEELQSIKPQRVIPGHGRPSGSLEETMAAQRVYLTQLLEDVRTGLQEGLFVHDVIQQTMGAGNPQGWLLFEEQHEGNVQRAYQELEWE